MAGHADFTPDEWMTMRRAMVAAGVLVSLAEGVVDSDEIMALMNELRGARFQHKNRLVRELAGVPGLETGLRHGTRFADYEGPALETIRAAVDTIGKKAPADLPAYQQFVVEVAEAVADANREGGFAGVGGQRRTRNEAAAIVSVRKALGC